MIVEYGINPSGCDLEKWLETVRIEAPTGRSAGIVDFLE
jgi:hypothetical protein